MFSHALYRLAAACVLFVLLSAFCAHAVHAESGVSVGPLHTSGRWIVDASGARVKFRCTSWAGHMETNTPEGLNRQPVDAIAKWMAQQGFNCVRLTYSIDMAIRVKDMSVKDSFIAAANATHLPESVFKDMYSMAVTLNPWLANATVLDAFSGVINALGAHGVMVVLDNHVSKAQWCCNLTDGNGWFNDSLPYVADNSRWFNPVDWLAGLTNMATYSRKFSNVVAMSLRNEMRPEPFVQDITHADWYSHVTKAASTVHATHPELLIVIGGVNGALDLSFLRDNPLDRSGWPNKTLWEYHVYSFSALADPTNCPIFQAEMDIFSGYILQDNQPFTGPLWISEWGVGMTGGAHNGVNDLDYAYLTCLVSWLEKNDADWSVWVLGGSYYVRDWTSPGLESYGILTADWSKWANPAFPAMMGGIWNQTLGPKSTTTADHIRQRMHTQIALE